MLSFNFHVVDAGYNVGVLITYGDDINITDAGNEKLKKSQLRDQYMQLRETGNDIAWPAWHSQMKRNIPSDEVKQRIAGIHLTRQYWQQVANLFPPRDSGNPRDIIGRLAKITPGIQPSETQPYKGLRDTLKAVYDQGQIDNWTPRLLVLPQPELIEAVRINGDAKAYGRIPASAQLLWPESDGRP
ncbi:hypothetical protein DL769_003949 [Monosporascus sp. CRB-8-3]|nr:hypothetical protein DL769_003949 [Monosporascus sp. CRB-8-3]